MGVPEKKKGKQQARPQLSAQPSLGMHAAHALGRCCAKNPTCCTLTLFECRLGRTGEPLGCGGTLVRPRLVVTAGKDSAALVVPAIRTRDIPARFALAFACIESPRPPLLPLLRSALRCRRQDAVHGRESRGHRRHKLVRYERPGRIPYGHGGWVGSRQTDG